ncbi:pinensin family lanthipeptide [Longimicrobium sp.]|uniref:pinensin family lanthipeptide n=1 Tax=Longimicrobium sp. TaxID=2029185 RepID=UPI002E2F8804|nr:pinensin family lanthipeptide [Longimicrobium sp.]HEX6039309.1 pinensin family lanthipeptide [Longimicrobium sp.]
MKKLSLKLDDLRIDSFATDAADGERGTVQGAQITAAGTCLCTRQGCYAPSEPGYATYVNNICIRC